MIARFFNALGWISMIISFFVLLVSYANYPDDVLVYASGVSEPVTYLSRDSVFYIALGFFVLINSAPIGIGAVLKKLPSETILTRAGLGITQIFANLFLAADVHFLSILNSRENFNYANFGYMIYVTGGLMIISIGFTLIARFVLKK